LTLQFSIDEEVGNGLYHIIKLFDKGILYFPRTISTRSLNFKQVEVFSKNEALFYFKQSNYIDCRINAFRSSNSKEKFYPDLIIIDIDRSDFKTEKGFKLALSTTLRNIREKLNGHPEIIWSGYGFHIYIPIEAIIFENYEILTEFINDFDLFKEFIRYSKNVLSNNKSDTRFKPSQDSSLLRIPGSLNGKFLNNRDKRLSGNFKVKVLQEWNGKRAVIPDDFLEDFRIHLIDKKIKEVKENKQNNNQHQQKYYNNNSIDWIEKLSLIGIEDHRKKAIDIIFVPYFILVKKLSNEETISKITEWLQKCNSIRTLDFDIRYRINAAIKTTNKKQIPPMKYSTLKNNYQYLYSLIQNKEALS
jgi:hypothetical protein